MGRHFLEHMGGRQCFMCTHCKTYLSNRKEILSENFRGATGPAFLFRHVVNVVFSKLEPRTMLTGRHLVRDVYCKRCKEKLGWMYEFACDHAQKYKEGYIILERRLMDEMEETHPYLMERSRPFGLTRTSSSSSVNSSSGISSVTVT